MADQSPDLAAAERPADGCGCQYDASGHRSRSRCICPPPMTREQTLRAVAGLGGGIGEAVASLLEERDTALAEVERQRKDRRHFLNVIIANSEWITAVCAALDMSVEAEPPAVVAVVERLRAIERRYARLHDLFVDMAGYEPTPTELGETHG